VNFDFIVDETGFFLSFTHSYDLSHTVNSI